MEADSTVAGKEIDLFLWFLKCQYLPLTQAGQERNVLHTVQRRKAMDCRNCLLKHVMEGNIEGWKYMEEDVNRYWMT